MWVQFLGQEDPLEQGMATHSSILAWEISWTEEPGRLQSMGFSRQEYWSRLPFPSPTLILSHNFILQLVDMVYHID